MAGNDGGAGADALFAANSLFSAAHDLVSTMDLTATLDAINPDATAAALAATPTDNVPEESTPLRPATDARLLGFISVIAGDDAVTARAALLKCFRHTMNWLLIRTSQWALSEPRLSCTYNTQKSHFAS